jgi:hypothetical protein
MVGDKHGKNGPLEPVVHEYSRPELFESGKANTWLPVIEENKNIAEGSERKNP